MNNRSEIWSKLKNDVIDSGLCTHCGTCVGLNRNILKFKETTIMTKEKINQGF